MEEKIALPIEVPQLALEDFCRRNHIQKLAFFGSVLRDDFGPESDLDIIVEFESGKSPGLFGLAGMQLELIDLFGGREVDLLTPGFFRPSLRKQIYGRGVGAICQKLKI